MIWVAGRSPNIDIEVGGAELSFFAEVAEGSNPDHWLWRVQVIDLYDSDDQEPYEVVSASCGSEGRAMFAATLALTAVTLT